MFVHKKASQYFFYITLFCKNVSCYILVLHLIFVSAYIKTYYEITTFKSVILIFWGIDEDGDFKQTNKQGCF
jgi:hypothetical protein